MNFKDAANSSAQRFPLAFVVVAVVIVAALAVGATATYYQIKNQAPQGTISVIDDAGRNVSVNGQPQRIVVLSPSVMDILYRLGLRSHVVATDCGTTPEGGRLGDYTPAQVQMWNLSVLACITWSGSLDIQSIVALNPDLVIGASGVNVASLDTLSTTDHIPSLYLNPATLLGIFYDVEIVGKLTQTTSQADNVVASMTQSLASDESNLTTASAPSVLVTYYDDSSGYWTFGAGSFGNDLVVQAKAVSISANDSIAEPEISGSYVLAANPDYIVVGTGFGLNVSAYSAGQDWSSLGAVQAGHVCGIDVTLLTEPDPSMVFGVNTLIQLLHPDLSPQ
jgi:ABC-type Fe3+-hydroxamate transport system substrate-binding protein